MSGKVNRRLRIWIMPTHLGSRTGPAIKRLIQPFLDQHPNLSIELRLIPWGDAFSEINQAFKSGDPPDLFQLGTTWLGAMANLGYPAKVPDSLETLPTLAPWIDAAVTMDGHRYGIPWFTECSYLMARQDILDQQRLTVEDLHDWDGLQNACEAVGRSADPALSDVHRPLPFAITIRPDYNTLHSITPILWSGGWKQPDLLERPIRLLSDPSAEAGWKYLSQLLMTNRSLDYVKLLEPHLIEANFYQNGRFAFYLGYSWNVIRHTLDPDSTSPFPVAFLPVPSGPAGNIGRGGGSILSVSSRSELAPEAWELAQFMIGTHFMKEWVKISGTLPSHESAFWEDYGDRTEIRFLKEQIRNARTYPTHPLWYSIEQSLFKKISDILWRYTQGYPYDAETRQITEAADDHINAIMNLAWDLH